DRDDLIAVGDLEPDGEIGAAREAAGLHQPTEPDAGARGDVFLHHVGRRVEKDDRVFECYQNKCDRHAENGAARTDQQQPPLPPRHFRSSTPATLPRGATSARAASRWRNLSASPASARRASAAASRARSSSPNTK